MGRAVCVIQEKRPFHLDNYVLSILWIFPTFPTLYHFPNLHTDFSSWQRFKVCEERRVPFDYNFSTKGSSFSNHANGPSNKYEKGGLTSVVQTNEFYYPVDRKTDLAMVGDSRGLFTGGWLFLRTAKYCSCLRREVQKNSIFEKTSIGRYCIMFRFESDRRPASWTVESHVSSRISQSFHPFVRRTVYHLGSESLVLSTNICRRTLEERAGAPLVASTLVVVVVLSSINVLVWKISRWQFGQTSCTEVCKTRLHRCNDLEKRFIVSNKRGR